MRSLWREEAGDTMSWEDCGAEAERDRIVKRESIERDSLKLLKRICIAIVVIAVVLAIGLILK